MALAQRLERPRRSNHPAPRSAPRARRGQAGLVESDPGGRPLLFPHELDRAKRGPAFFGRREEARLFAQPAPGDPPRVVVVGVQLEQRERALETLGGALGIGGPLGLLLAGLAGYAIASGALSPVESMRRRAAGAEPGERLPLPPPGTSSVGSA